MAIRDDGAVTNRSDNINEGAPLKFNSNSGSTPSNTPEDHSSETAANRRSVDGRERADGLQRLSGHLPRWGGRDEPGIHTAPHGEGHNAPLNHGSPIDAECCSIEGSSKGSENGSQAPQTSKSDEKRGFAGSDGPKIKWQLSPEQRLSAPGGTIRETCSASVRDAIIEHHPDAMDDSRVIRWIVAARFCQWLDNDTGRRLIPWQMLEWVAGKKFATRGVISTWNGAKILRYLRDETTLDGLEVASYVPKERCRTIINDGIHPSVVAAIERDLQTPPSELTDRLYVVSGKPMRAQHGHHTRQAWERQLPEARQRAPSETARMIFDHMNGISPRRLSKITDRIPEAMDRVMRRPYSSTVAETNVQRMYYLQVLRNINAQHKPFYRFSANGRTDRIFGWNRSALDLPSDVRRVLFDGYHNIDLKSAHLCIAASLWGAELAERRLRDPEYSVWDDLMQHYAPIIQDATGDSEPSQSLYSAVKGCLKPAVYSTVYGMPETNVKGKLTERMRDVVGEDAGSDAGDYFGRHDLMRSLFDARKEQLEQIQRTGGMRAADGRWINLNPSHNNPAASVLATVAQSYEQALMRVLVEYEQETTSRFRVCLWLHDGAYVQMRSRRARMKDLRRRLEQRAEELGVIAHFDHDVVTTPTHE